MLLVRPALGVLGYVLSILAGFMLMPLLVIESHGSLNQSAILLSFSATMTASLLLVLMFKGYIYKLNSRRMFMITGLTWIGVSAFSALPLVLSSQSMSMTDAVFESVSGITTTGSTVLLGLDRMPREILLWRSIMQWIGGVGVIGMAIAILPFLQTGGMRLFRTESSDWSERTVAHSGVMVRMIMVAYAGVSLACMLFYLVAGMDLFDAVNHAMTTISTGGFSTRDQSIGYFSNPWIQVGAIFFMIIGGLPFTMYINVLVNRRLNLLQDQQVVAFLAILFGAGVILSIYLMATTNMSMERALIDAFMNTTSVITTTGFASRDYNLWGTGAVAIFFFLMVVGGCSGSTSGGFKVFRLQLMWIFVKEQLIRSAHPSAVVSMKYNGHRISNEVVSSFLAFTAMATASFVLLTVGLGLTGLDLVTSTSGALTALMNVGPGLGGTIGPSGTFYQLSDAAKWLLCIGMLLGRLEYLTLFILLYPSFWKD